MRIPQMSLHSTGNWRVRAKGKCYYLGKVKSTATQRYCSIIHGLYGQEGLPSHSITVAVLLGKYTDSLHREGNRKWITDRIHQLNQATSSALGLYGSLPVECFGPLAFQRAREDMARVPGRSRAYVNGLCGKLRSAFRWGVSQELVSQNCYDRLMSVRELTVGALGLKEGKGARPVEIGHIQAVLPLLADKWADITRLLLLTGARPSEILGLRPVDLKQLDDCLMSYEPQRHKTEKRNRKRVILLNQTAVTILRRYWPSTPEGLFFPRRCQPVLPYDAQVLAQAVKKACTKAGLPVFTPYQIRHRVLTDISLKHGREVAQAVGGHASIIMTAHYDHGNLERAKRAVSDLVWLTGAFLKTTICVDTVIGA